MNKYNCFRNSCNYNLPPPNNRYSFLSLLFLFAYEFDNINYFERKIDRIKHYK